ncbi:TetR/AcrR family transcriptional regulator [Companilactobacillus farciminis]|nr:TetR/AcrR family transcriptional regulator [Companilactobacillus farciminis]
MKYDLSQNITRGAQRTLNNFSNELLYLISIKNFNLITVNEICSHANYPRATFYNYFDDKYDLLNYAFHTIAKELQPDLDKESHQYQILDEYFEEIYDLFSSESSFIKKVLQHNNYDDTLIQSFIIFLQNIVQKIFYSQLNKNTEKESLKIPLDLLADHYSNTLLLIFDWAFLRGHQVSKKEAKDYLNLLLKN